MTTQPNILLLWNDIETTGLDYDQDLILEMAWQLTDYAGAPLTEITSSITIDYSDEAMMRMVLERYRKAAPYVKNMHSKNGLWNEVFFVESDTRSDLFHAIDDMLIAVDEVREDAEVRLAGSSIGFDKRFLETAFGGELPISHRVHDLSTFRPFFQWQGVDLDSLTLDLDLEDGTHRAAADIRRDVAQWSNLIQLMQDAGMFEG
jgi:oligoribonuclease (3'-5' exoribonuclease)